MRIRFYLLKQKSAHSKLSVDITNSSINVLSSYQTFESNSKEQIFSISNDSIAKQDTLNNEVYKTNQVESISERLHRIKLELSDVLADINILEKSTGSDSSILKELESQTMELLHKTNNGVDKVKPFALYTADIKPLVSMELGNTMESASVSRDGNSTQQMLQLEQR